ncbi:MAG: DUF6318 family protein [Brevundimonas sp.]
MVASAIGLAGCTGGEVVTDPPARTSSPKTTSALSAPAESPTTPTPKPPTARPTPTGARSSAAPTRATPADAPSRTATMELKDAAGARAVAEYFVNLTPYVLFSLDTREWKAMSLKDCKFCASVLSTVKTYRTHNQREVGGQVALTTRYVLQATDTSVLVHMRATEVGSVIVNAKGKAVRRLPAPKPFTLNVLMHFERGRWRVRAVGVNEKGGAPESFSNVPQPAARHSP